MKQPLSVAIAALNAGRHDDAMREAELVWWASADFRAASLCALVEIDRGRPGAALDWTLLASQARPHDHRLRLQAGRLLSQLGRPREALQAFEEAVQLAPMAAIACLELGKALVAANSKSRAVSILRQALTFGAPRDEALQALVDAIPTEIAPPSRVHVVLEHERVPISIACCSIDDERYARAHASYARALADWPHELVRIDDAKSLAEGYTRALQFARHSIVVFTHDDVEILADALGHRLQRHLDRCDIVGIAGAERASGPSWVHAGHPWLHGCVVLPGSHGYEVNVYSERGPLVDGLQVLDGVFLAMRSETARTVGWDAQAFTHFHAYDVDFTLRASKSGYRVAAATDLGVLHHSQGSYGDAWAREAAKLVSKHPELGTVRSVTVKGFGRVLPDVAAARAFCEQWGIEAS